MRRGKNAAEDCGAPKFVVSLTRTAELAKLSGAPAPPPAKGRVERRRPVDSQAKAANVTCVTPPTQCGTRIALYQVMTFHCRFCRQDFAWESASYTLIWSRILVHLGQCAPASWLSRDERSIEARRTADLLLGERRGGASTGTSVRTRSSQRRH